MWAPPAPVWSFRSPRHCLSAGHLLCPVLPFCPFTRAFPYPQPGDVGGCRSAPARQWHCHWQHWRIGALTDWCSLRQNISGLNVWVMSPHLCRFSHFCTIQTQTVRQTTKLHSCTGKTAESTRKRWQQLCKQVGMTRTSCCRHVLNSCTKLNRTACRSFLCLSLLENYFIMWCIWNTIQSFGIHVASV